MSRKRARFSKPTIAIGVFGLAVGLFAGLSVLMTGKPATGGRIGLVDDWTTHHVIFSNPGTATEAMREGRYEQWYRTVNDPRFVMQQMKRHPELAASTASAQDYGTLFNRLMMSLPVTSVPAAKAPPKKAPAPHRDWAFSLGTGTVAQNMSPAKFSFNINGTPSCTSDFAVYGLNVAGSAGGQANLVGLHNLYSASTGTNFCGGTGPTVFWAYHGTTTTAGKVTTSPLISYDATGSEIMYVESGGSAGPYLHVLVWNSSDGGTVAASKAPTHVLAAGTGVSGCTAGASCLVSILLNTTTETVTNSSPFYDYNSDTIYVGDDVGTLYKVHPVLGSGTPGVSKLTVASTTLTGPVLDYSSGNIFVGGTNGVLYAITASTFTAATHSTLQVGHANPCTSTNNVLVDAPIVDSTIGWVYEYSTDNPSNQTVVEQASTAGPAGSGFTGVAVEVGVGDNGCDSSAQFPTHQIDFDNNYYNGTVTNGHIWVCGRGGGNKTSNNSAAGLFEIPTSGTNGLISAGSAVSNSNQIDTSNSHEQCSPFTEIENGTTDFLFFGEGLSGSFTDVFGFTIADTTSATETATEISGSPLTTYPIATGGTSAIVIDNVSASAQASSLYFTTLATSTTICGGTAAYCAIKLTQAGLN